MSPAAASDATHPAIDDDDAVDYSRVAFASTSKKLSLIFPLISHLSPFDSPDILL